MAKHSIPEHYPESDAHTLAEAAAIRINPKRLADAKSAAGCFDLINWDIWWHLRTGQLIWQRGHVPRTDWFTYTNPDAQWTDLHWGFQLLSAGLWAWGGSGALVLAKCVVGASTIGI